MPLSPEDLAVLKDKISYHPPSKMEFIEQTSPDLSSEEGKKVLEAQLLRDIALSLKELPPLFKQLSPEQKVEVRVECDRVQAEFNKLARRSKTEIWNGVVTIGERLTTLQKNLEAFRVIHPVWERSALLNAASNPGDQTDPISELLACNQYDQSTLDEAVFSAASQGNSIITELLRKRGGVLTSRAAIAAALGGHVQTITYIANIDPSLLQADQTNGPLAHAASQGCQAAVTVLLQAQLHTDTVKTDALLKATAQGYDRVVSALLQKGADPHADNDACLKLSFKNKQAFVSLALLSFFNPEDRSLDHLRKIGVVPTQGAHGMSPIAIHNAEAYAEELLETLHLRQVAQQERHEVFSSYIRGHNDHFRPRRPLHRGPRAPHPYPVHASDSHKKKDDNGNKVVTRVSLPLLSTLEKLRVTGLSSSSLTDQAALLPQSPA